MIGIGSRDLAERASEAYFMVTKTSICPHASGLFEVTREKVITVKTNHHDHVSLFFVPHKSIRQEHASLMCWTTAVRIGEVHRVPFSDER
jgi:hypothetical protein